MPRHILVPIDSSEQSRAALEHAVTEYPEETVTAIHVLDPADQHVYGGIEGDSMIDPEAIRVQRREATEQLLEEAKERASAHDVTIDTEIQTGSTTRTIVDYAEDQDVDHIVIGSHGRSGASRILLGSVAETVARRSPVPVTIVR